MVRKKNGRNNRNNRKYNKPIKPQVVSKSTGTKTIKNVPIDYTMIPVQIKDHNDINGGHPHAIMDNIDNCHVSVGLSTKKTKGKNGGNNYPMQTSPLGDGKDSYMRRQAGVYPVREYNNPRNGAMTEKDYAQAKKYADKAKQKYIDKKNKKDE